MNEPVSALRCLFPDVPVAEFVASYYPNRPLVRHGPLARFGALAEDPLFLDPRALIERSPTAESLVYVTLPGDRRCQSIVPKTTALQLFDEGMSVDSGSLHLSVPLLGEWVSSMRGDLGLPRPQLLCDAILSPAGHGVPKHFDGVETLTVQLAGRKAWKIAPNREVELPDTSCFPSLKENRRDGQRPVPPSFPKRFAPEMPADAEALILEPGSAVFLPRGYWHETLALEPCISLSFVIMTPDIGRLVSSAVARHLQDFPRWRAPVPLGSNEQRAAARGVVAERLAELAARIAELRPEDVLPAFEDPTQLFGAVLAAFKDQLKAPAVADDPDR